MLEQPPLKHFLSVKTSLDLKKTREFSESITFECGRSNILTVKPLPSCFVSWKHTGAAGLARHDLREIFPGAWLPGHSMFAFKA